jgi:hypothetical protein
LAGGGEPGIDRTGCYPCPDGGWSDAQAGFRKDRRAKSQAVLAGNHHQGDGVGPAEEAIGEKNGPKGPNEPSKQFRIMELTYGTNPHEPKTKPVSPLDLMGVLKRTHNQATKSFRFALLLKRTQLLRVPPELSPCRYSQPSRGLFLSPRPHLAADGRFEISDLRPPLGKPQKAFSDPYARLQQERPSLARRARGKDRTKFF